MNSYNSILLATENMETRPQPRDIGLACSLDTCCKVMETLRGQAGSVSRLEAASPFWLFGS